MACVVGKVSGLRGEKEKGKPHGCNACKSYERVTQAGCGYRGVRESASNRQDFSERERGTYGNDLDFIDILLHASFSSFPLSVPAVVAFGS